MTKKKAKSKEFVNRRQFISKILSTVCSVGIVGTGLAIYAKQSAFSLPAMAIRPPGALPEDEFASACIRCGLCVKDCPYDILKLGEIGQDIPTGTPYFTARKKPCEMCEDIPCITNCPTNALDHSLKDIEKSKMGLAVVVDQETCIAFLGLRCEVCFNVCPIQGKAITLEYDHNERSGKHARFIPIVHSDGCTGCGLCERACILEEAAIKVFPIHLAKGQIGEHYRLGWQEKEKSGQSLVAPDIKHEYYMPEGMSYDLQGEGVIFKKDDTPFSSNPLNTINKGFDNDKND